MRQTSFMLCMVLGMVCSASVVTLAGEDHLSQAEALLERLTEPSLALSDQDAILKKLHDQGVLALPVLIGHLTDHRPAGTKRVGNVLPGECYNAPLGTPLPVRCQQPSEIVLTMDIAGWCHDLLYQILTPSYISPYANRVDREKAVGERTFLVTNWPAWWKKYNHQDLDALHAMARRLIDRFWRRGWSKGPVEWK